MKNALLLKEISAESVINAIDSCSHLVTEERIEERAKLLEANIPKNENLLLDSKTLLL